MSLEIAPKNIVSATRNNLHIGRRLFHFSCGTIVASAYALYFNHEETVFYLGGMATCLYLFEQVRINYPELSIKFSFVSKFLLRQEETDKESAAMPYIMSVLLTILTFPKTIAIAAIFILAVADPMSAIIGIKYGKTKIAKRKSLEGSLAFFTSTFLILMAIFLTIPQENKIGVFFMSLSVSFIISIFELIPLRLDDNLTIPLVSALAIWLASRYLEVSFF